MTHILFLLSLAFLIWLALQISPVWIGLAALALVAVGVRAAVRLWRERV